MPTQKLPRGLWFDAERNRWRVRLWRNTKMFISYHDTYEEALSAHTALKAVTRMVPKRVRRTRTEPVGTPPTSLAGLMQAAKKVD